MMDDMNDPQAMGLMNQLIREKRLDKWDEWKDKVLHSDKVSWWEDVPSQGKITISLHNPFGADEVIDYYPKANKVLIRKDNDWKKPGLKWLIENLVNG